MRRRIHEAEALSSPDLWPIRLGVDRGTAPLNLAVELIDRHLPARGSHAAIVDGDGRLTYREVAERVAQTSHALRRAGIGPGDRVLIRLPNDTTLPVVWLAAARLGAISVVTSTALRTRELEAIVADAEPAACVVAAEFSDDLMRACDAAPLPPRVLMTGRREPIPPGAIALDDLAASAPTTFDAVTRPPDAIAAIAYSADPDAAAPKGACYSVADLLVAADRYAAPILGLTAADVLGGPATPAFAFGLGAILVFPLRAGATCILAESFDAEHLVRAVVSERITVLFATATAYRLLLRLPALDRLRENASLRVAVSSGERLDADTALEWQRRTGVELLDAFGTTEMTHIFLSQRPGDCGTGRLGDPIPGYEIRLVDERFEDVGAGVPGRLVVRGPTGCRYWRRPAAQQRYVQRGWNVTGDWCVRDERGLRYLGRRDDLIISAGYNLSAVEIERALREHPAVADAAVVAAADPTRGAVPSALVVLAAGVSRTGIDVEILQYVRTTLAPYKCPRQIEIVAALPRTAAGAIDRASLVRR